MKLIFSRKGFDSGSGGAPSPLLPNGKMLTIPIPDRMSTITYKDIQWEGGNLGEMVENITKGRVAATHCAHLDPDMIRASLDRHKDWRPLFGQIGAAQGHLRNQGIGSGDLFLFFGLFQEVIVENEKVRLDAKSKPRHLLWGWFQVDRCLAVDELDRNQFAWACYHPHFQRPADKSNTIYLPQKVLDLPGLGDKKLPGAGVFTQFSSKLQLTAPHSRTSLWRLPLWMFPEDETSAMSYHQNLARWEKREDHILLSTVGRGQEFVLNCRQSTEAGHWINSLFEEFALSKKPD